MSAKMRQRVERSIAKKVILDGIAAGYAINVNNGGDIDELAAPSVKIKEILAVMFATDDERLLFYKKEKYIGWVWLIYGNSGWDVVSDYTTNLREIMKGASELADKYA